MNERINELRFASKIFASDSDGKIQTDTAALEMFAELIIKETMQVVANSLAPNSYLDVVEAVIEHFGV